MGKADGTIDNGVWAIFNAADTFGIIKAVNNNTVNSLPITEKFKATAPAITKCPLYKDLQNKRNVLKAYNNYISGGFRLNTDCNITTESFVAPLA